MRLSLLQWITLFFVAFMMPANASGLKPTQLEPITLSSASLTIEDHNGVQTVYDISDLEQFPTYSLTTATPWREEPARFEGVMLSDILERHGLQEMEMIAVAAENDYVVRFNRVIWSTVPILVATRVNGAPISRRERGPIQFVIDADAMVEHDDILSERYLVWMAASLKPHS